VNQHLLTDALLDEERHTPDPAAVLAGVRRGIVRRRRRRQVSAALAAVLAIVATAWAVPRSTAPAPAAAPAWTVHLRLTWLPEPLPPAGAFDAGRYGESALYGDEAAGPYLVAALDVPAPDLPGGTDTTINGRPARYLTAPTRTQVAWTLPSGRRATLEYGDNAAPNQPDRQSDALRAAAGVRDDDSRVLRAVVAPGYLPPGLTVTGVTGDGGFRADAGGGTAIAVVLSDPSAGNGAEAAGWPRVRDVQGHPAYTRDDGRQLFVVDFHGRTLILLAAGAPPPSVEDLVRTAEALTWTG
jgi:hypothetical protein